MHFIDGMVQRNIPLSVFHFDCFWMREFHWCDFEWDKRTFPDPEGMLRRLKERGLHICVWINPYIAQRSYLFEEGMTNGYQLRRPDGSVWQTDLWQAGLGIVDFTNPEARKWFQSKLRRLLEMGVDCFKTDFGERIPTDVVYHDGSDPVGCITFTLTCTTKTCTNCWCRSEARARLCCLPALPQRVDKSFRCTGAAIALPPTNRWRRAYVADCRSAFVDSASGATTSAAL